MTRRSYLLALTAALLFTGVGDAQQFPVADSIADKLVKKYQQSTCEQLWQEKMKPQPKSAEEQKVIGILKADPQMRTEFINRVAAPIVNKMFECGMIP